MYAAVLPKALKKNEEVTIEFESVQTHATYPWPEEAGQKDGQALKYDTDLFVVSPYKTSVERIKFKYATLITHCCQSHLQFEQVALTQCSLVFDSGGSG